MRFALPALGLAVLLVAILSLLAGEEPVTMFRLDSRHTGVAETRGVEAICGVRWRVRGWAERFPAGSFRSLPENVRPAPRSGGNPRHDDVVNWRSARGVEIESGGASLASIAGEVSD